MDRSDQLFFGPFRLDFRTGRLWRDDTELTLRPRSFAVLCYLLERAGRLVPAEEFFREVWRHDHISRSALRLSIREIRLALEDSAQSPKYLETVRGRGYRLSCPMRSSREASDPARQADVPSPVVGRRQELRQLERSFDRSLCGARQLVLIGGEAGIGKTTLVDTFLRHHLEGDALRVGRGQCLERNGEGEAYLPVLEALEQLGRAADGALVVSTLRELAPSWLLQLPAFSSERERERLLARGTSRRQMLHELADALEALSADSPLVLVLEDLHWSDPSTIDWLTVVARRTEAARLLVLGTYRHADARLHAGALLACLHELRAHDLAAELELGGLEPEEIAEYGHRRLGQPLLPETGALLHRVSAGNAMFVTRLIDCFVERQDLVCTDAGWTLREAAMSSLQIPSRLSHLLARQIEQLPSSMRQALEIASVVGERFSAAAVSACAERSIEAIDALCTEAVRLGGLIEADGLAKWPDQTVSGRYRFRHALVQQALYGRVGAGPRSALHRRIGSRLEQAYGERSADIAATLAGHFEEGQDSARAARYLQLAARQSLQRNAYAETAAHARAALVRLRSLPQTPERARSELELLIVLRSALVPTVGPRAPEVGKLYERAGDLCDELDEGPQLVLALGGLARWHWHIRSDIPTALESARRQSDLAERLSDRALVLRARCNLGPLLYAAGRFDAARASLEQAVGMCDTLSDDDAVAITGYWGYVAESRGYLALTLWHLGYPDKALVRVDEALARITDTAQPFSFGWALVFAATVCALRGETEAASRHVASLSSLATQKDYPDLVAISSIFYGSALADAGQTQKAIEPMRQGIAAHRDRTALGLAGYLTRLAEVYGRAGQPDRGLQTIAEASELIRRSGEQAYAAEAHRVHAELVQAHSAVADAKAEFLLRKALELARSQQSKAIALRVALSISCLWQRRGECERARDVLSCTYGSFTEGFDTPELRRVKKLLDARARVAR